MSKTTNEFLSEVEKAINEIKGIEYSLGDGPDSRGQRRLLELQVARLEAERNYLLSRQGAQAA
ncbi:MAG: hypothetical protein GF344_18565 [Chitinivibrionales bacterium]|nr:hypothetical protein [Chitinivibrionales bacterium]MBD3358652.1 hypothetical protein [Chitinivibrionales bacterium]